jgi:TM2 domain-containing membrane protein YozV
MLKDLSLSTVFSLTKDAALAFGLSEFVAPYEFVKEAYEAGQNGQQVWLIGQQAVEISQLLQSPKTGTSTLGSVQLEITPTASTLFMQQAAVPLLPVNIQDYARNNLDRIQVLQVTYAPGTSQIVSVTDEPTTAVDLGCTPSSSCTPSITATVPSLNSVFVLAIPIPANLTKNLTNVTTVNWTAAQITTTQATTSMGSPGSNSISSGQNAGSGNEQVGLAVLAMVALISVGAVYYLMHYKGKAKAGTTAKPKSPGIAAVLSLFLPGLGQLYAGKTGPGVVLIILSIVFGLLSFVFIGIPFIIIIWLYGMYDAYKTAEATRGESPKTGTAKAAGSRRK